MSENMPLILPKDETCDMEDDDVPSKESYWKRSKVVMGVGGAVIGGVVAVVAAPALIAAAGFGARGVIAGSFAADWQSNFGGAVPAGSWFAKGQSAGAAGLASKTKAAIGVAGAAVGGTIGMLATEKQESGSKTRCAAGNIIPLRWHSSTEAAQAGDWFAGMQSAGAAGLAAGTTLAVEAVGTTLAVEAVGTTLAVEAVGTTLAVGAVSLAAGTKLAVEAAGTTLAVGAASLAAGTKLAVEAAGTTLAVGAASLAAGT